jgi:tetratricopeptide (TPR) repeat protein
MNSTQLNTDERWLYYIDDEVVHSLLRAEPELEELMPGMKERAVASAAVVQAVALHLEGRKEEAVNRLRKAADAPDAEADVFSFLACFELERNRWDEAAKLFQRALTRNPQSKLDLYNLGICRYREEKWQEACDLFRRAADIDLENGRLDCLAARGVCHLHLGEAEVALDVFEQVLRQDKESRAAQFGKAVALQLLRRKEDADVLYRRIQAMDETQGRAASPDLLLNRLAIAQASFDETLTRELAERLLTHAKPIYQAAAHEALASLAFHRERYSEAAKHCEKLVEMAPGGADGWLNLGIARQQLGQARPAIEAYLQAIELDPSIKQAHANLGYLHHQRGDSDHARQAYVEALNLDPAMGDTLWNLAVLLEQKGHDTEATVVYEQLTRLAPDWPDPWFRLGSSHLAGERWELAGAAFEQCLSLKGDWPDAAAGLAFAKAQQGERAAAIQILERVRAKEPRPAVLFNLGVLHQQAGRPLEAEKMYRAAIEKKADFPEALLNLGHALQDSGKGEEAQEYWRKAVRLNPAFASGYFV